MKEDNVKSRNMLIVVIKDLSLTIKTANTQGWTVKHCLLNIRILSLCYLNSVNSKVFDKLCDAFDINILPAMMSLLGELSFFRYILLSVNGLSYHPLVWTSLLMNYMYRDKTLKNNSGCLFNSEVMQQYPI